MFRSDLFVGKVALVSGGGTGIGYCITNELATCGATVVIASRDQSKCQEAAATINKALPAGCQGRVIAAPSTRGGDCQSNIVGGGNMWWSSHACK